MRTRSLATAFLAVGLAVFALAGCGGGDDDGGGGGNGNGEATAEEVSVPLEEVAGSGQTGEATLTAVEGNQTHVLILIDGEGVSGNQPAHVHEGTCEQLNPEPAYGLNEVQNSFSDTTIDVPLATLTAGEYAINLHRQPTDLETYTSCGNIGAE